MQLNLHLHLQIQIYICKLQIQNYICKDDFSTRPVAHVSVWDKKLDLESILSVQDDMNFVLAKIFEIGPKIVANNSKRIAD